MIEASEIHSDVQTNISRRDDQKSLHRPIWKHWSGQFIRFGFVGVLNTLLDILLLNGLLWLFPTTHTFLILLFNSLAYGVGAINSFFLNKYWTFNSRQQTTWNEVKRFTLTTLLGIVCNDILVWLAGNLFLSFISNSALTTNASKLFAIAGTVFVSYLSMRLWVFVKKPQNSVSPAPQKIVLMLPDMSMQNHSCISQASCPQIEIGRISTRKLQMNSKIKKILLVNIHA